MHHIELAKGNVLWSASTDKKDFKVSFTKRDCLCVTAFQALCKNIAHTRVTRLLLSWLHFLRLKIYTCCLALLLMGGLHTVLAEVKNCHNHMIARMQNKATIAVLLWNSFA
eukprot:3790733-Amphidinium_carterae.1